MIIPAPRSSGDPHRLSEGGMLSVPRYRVEEHSPDLAAGIVGFADSIPGCQDLVAVRAAHLLRERRQADLVVIDQETEPIVTRREVR